MIPANHTTVRVESTLAGSTFYDYNPNVKKYARHRAAARRHDSDKRL
jgi:hypothetical protein